MAKFLNYPNVVPATEHSGSTGGKGVEVQYWHYSMSRNVAAAGGDPTVSGGTLADQPSISNVTVTMAYDPEIDAKLQYQLVAATQKTTDPVELVETQKVGDKHVEILHIKLTGCFITHYESGTNHETVSFSIYFDQIDVLQQVRDPQTDEIKGSTHFTYDKAAGTSAV